MSVRNTSPREVSCTGKTPLTFAQTKHSRLHPYRCRFCGYWHVGNGTGVERPGSRRPPRWQTNNDDEDEA